MKVRRWLWVIGAPVRWVLLQSLRAYRFFLSPWIGQQCRFWPSCSNYASESIEKHGAIAGTYLASKRLLRCHPWCQGGHDPVPEKSPCSGLFNGAGRSTDTLNR
ncbi:MAG: membrane protein insertion efficiency factor YidD [Burkholderiales bacterium]|jgi:putative membrane protein insertion efficiency factor